MAQPGYGKRSAPDQHPRSRTDFAQLPTREAYLAAFIDQLPDGAAIDVKTLTKEQPLYGQQAVRTALNNLSAAGHLRRVRERVDSDRTQWVFRTYFSRTPRSDAWWNAFLTTGKVHPDEHPEPRPCATGHSPAYRLLADLGRLDRRLILSAADCTALEPLAAEWLARDPDRQHLVTALTAGLPDAVHSPRALLRTRLEAKLPPQREPEQPAIPTAIIECTDCRAPARPHALLGGLCRACRPNGEAGHRSAPPRHHAPDDVRARVAELRASARRGGEIRAALTRD